MRCSEAGNAFTVIAGFTMLRHRLSKYASSKGSASGDAFVLAPRYYALSVMPPSGKTHILPYIWMVHRRLRPSSSSIYS